ncbi:hypothetical protein C0581_01410 [Candidatus Parcubacteria bacterium]|nr:MAG: hypothetical protein C0581_01410 [Candidatus Parcubacteria bacterium]
MKKTMTVFIIIISVIAIVYLFLLATSVRKYPVDFGVSFNHHHASSLGLDWKQVYTSMLDELKPEYIRIAAMWSDVEKVEGVYDFSYVDFMMDNARERGTKVTLVLGQKAPRWPECHVPEWVVSLSEKEYEEKLLAYDKAVVERYKNHEALELWQVENEPFIKFRFGECSQFREDLVDEEIDLVHRLDEVHWVMVTDSGELSTWRQASKAGDLFGTTLYRIVRTPKGHIWTYDWLPASFYRLKARLLGIPMEQMYVAELQAEPWFTDSTPDDTPIEEQEKTMNIDRIQKHIDYTERIGVRRTYLWGVEWWYWMREKHDDARYWDIIKNKMK